MLSLGGAPATRLRRGPARGVRARRLPAAFLSGGDVMKRAARLALRAYVAAEHRERSQQGPARGGRRRRDPRLRREPAQAPARVAVRRKSVLGVDPGIRTGCKLAVVERVGRVPRAATSSTSDPTRARDGEAGRCVAPSRTPTSRQWPSATAPPAARPRRSSADARGARAREVPVVMVSESGRASTARARSRARSSRISTSRSAARSRIARRLQDPLAELVKVDPKSIGVGQYQHDVTPGLLKKSLETVVESCVNAVGVNVNTASPYLLADVAGIGPSLARGIAEHREKKGLFKAKRSSWVSRFSARRSSSRPRASCASPAPRNPLDNTGSPPRALPAAREARRAPRQEGRAIWSAQERRCVSATRSSRAEVGQFTFDDIVRSSRSPAATRASRSCVWSFRDDIHELKDLKPGMVCPGIVTNVTNFGAFVDIGVHQDGLVHISQLADRFVKDPREVVSPGDRVTVRVVEVNLDEESDRADDEEPNAAPNPTPSPRPRPTRPPSRSAPTNDRRQSPSPPPATPPGRPLQQPLRRRPRQQAPRR